MRRLVAAAAIAVAGGLLACAPKYPLCKTNDQCKDHNQVCVEGQCKECGADSDCQPNFVCKDNACVPKPQCAADADCPAGQKCKAGKCAPECAADADCAAGMKCNAGKCVARAMCASDADCAAGMGCQNGTCVQLAALQVQKCNLQRVHFDFNSANLSSQAEQILDQDAECLKKAPLPSTLELAGNCDERGTEEYNLQLGQRRADAVLKYLETQGVDASKLKAISYGKDRPIATGHDEASWAKNRRVDLGQDAQ